jgi:hypothetical protein
MQGDTHFKNKIKTFNAYTLPKVHLLTQWYHFCSKVLKVCISGAW